MSKNIPKSVEGFTLVEVMMGFFVLAVVVGGIFSATIMTKRVALQNLYENAAYATARGYAEQLKAMNYDDVRDAIMGGASVALDFTRLDFDENEGTLANLEDIDSLSFGRTFPRTVTVDDLGQRSGSAPKKIQVDITLTGNDLLGVEGWEALEITVGYSWKFNSGISSRTLSKSIKLLKTNV